ncbi:MAG: polysaccharide deacetylase family protein [Methanotrichaceae archaeon]|nr:polysaccharide deacetylase family protein [Methanotrichaceae archaeon]
MINALSIDLEYWWSAEFFKRMCDHGNKKDLIYESVDPILDLLDKYGIHATFFIQGLVAENYPELIEQIFDQGHEIAYHGYSHKPLYEMNEMDFEREIEISMRSLSRFRPVGFRAPSFSLTNDTKWALKILADHGFKYDSSVFPVRVGLYGIPNAPLGCYKPSDYDIVVNDPKGDIKEIPLSVLRLCKFNIPVAGGFYLRIFPVWFLKRAIDLINKERPAVLYLHPWETFADLPRHKDNYFFNFVNYYGLSSALYKLEYLLKCFQFQPIKEIFL